MRQYDCEPTLNDTEVLEFCKNGFMMFEGVVSDEINRRTNEYLDEHDGMEPTDILDEDWFMDGVIKHPAVAGALRSLLGKDFGLPNLVSNHRIQCPQPAQEWHYDGGDIFGPQLNYIQVFYYPQDCPRELGPTELLPGSHFLYSERDMTKHLGRIRGSYHAVSPAGSIFLTDYSIWHRRSESWGSGLRNNVKYNYWRTSPPTRDWVIDPGFDPATADYTFHGPTFRKQFQDCYDAAEMYFWLRGEHDKFELIGGQGWPIPGNRNDIPYGVPEGIGR